MKHREHNHAYSLAQSAIADLKTAIHFTLANSGYDGLRNADIGLTLGIYTGHVEHEGYIPRSLLALIEAEGAVEQNKDNVRNFG